MPPFSLEQLRNNASINTKVVDVTGDMSIFYSTFGGQRRIRVSEHAADFNEVWLVDF